MKKNKKEDEFSSNDSLLDTNESFCFGIPVKKANFSEKTNIKNISEKIIDSNNFKGNKKKNRNNNIIEKQFNEDVKKFDDNKMIYSNKEFSEIVKNSPKISSNKVFVKSQKKIFLPEVIDEVEDSKNDISLFYSNNKLNNSNNNIITNKLNNISIINNSETNECLEITKKKLEKEIKINDNNNNIIKSKQKFITIENYLGLDFKRTSKKKNDSSKSNLQQVNHEDIKSHNLLSFFKNTEIINTKLNYDLNKSKNFSHLVEKNQKSDNKSISIVNESKFKFFSSDNNLIEIKNTNQNLTTNKAMLTKFLLDSKSKYKENCISLNFSSKSQFRNNLTNVSKPEDTNIENLQNPFLNNKIRNNIKANAYSKKNNFLERKRSSVISATGDKKLSMSFTKDSQSLNIPFCLELGINKKIEKKKNKLMEPFKKSDSIKSDFIIKISSIGLIDSEKLKLKGFELSCKNIKYLGDSFNNIDESDFVVIKNQGLFAFQDIRFIYAIFHKFLKYDCPLNIIDAAKDNNYEISKKIIRFKFFNDFDRKSQINLKSFDNYIVPLPEIDFASYYKNVLNNIFPLQGYRIQPDPSLFLNSQNQKDEIKQKIINNLIKIIGATVVDHIRQSDFCIIESFDSSTFKIPPQVMPLKLSYLIDALIFFKQPNFDMLQYKPQDKNKKKLRK